MRHAGRARRRRSCASPARRTLVAATARARRSAGDAARADRRAVARSTTTSAATPDALLGGFVRRIDRLKAELIGAEEYAALGGRAAARPGRRRSSASSPRSTRRTSGCWPRPAPRRRRPRATWRSGCCAPTASRRGAEPVRARADRRRPGARPGRRRRWRARWPGRRLTVAGDPDAGAAALPRRRRGAAAMRLETRGAGRAAAMLRQRCARLGRSGAAVRSSGDAAGPRRSGAGGTVEFWRCANERAQAQAVAAEIERLVAREAVDAGRDRGARARDSRARGRRSRSRSRSARCRTGWSARRPSSSAPRSATCSPGCGCSPTLATPPPSSARWPGRRSSCARSTSRAARRSRGGASSTWSPRCAAATESPQVPPEARERIRVFLKLYRVGVAAIDTTRPDLYVHRLIERLGLRRQQLFAAQADVVERLRALARLRRARRRLRAPLAAGDPARVRALDRGRRRLRPARARRSPSWPGAGAVQVLALAAAGGLEVDHVYRRSGCSAGLGRARARAVPDALLREPLPADDEETAVHALRQLLYVGDHPGARAGRALLPGGGDRGAPLAPLAAARGGPRRRSAASGRTAGGAVRPGRDAALDLPAAARRAARGHDAGRRAARRAALRHRPRRLPRGRPLSRAAEAGGADRARPSEAGRRPRRCATSTRGSCAGRHRRAAARSSRSSALDDYLLDAERDARRRAQVIAARDEPSLEPFLPHARRRAWCSRPPTSTPTGPAR